MLIMVAGPYTASTKEQCDENFYSLNTIAAQVLGRGHIPVIGLNAALPVVEQASVRDPYKAIMDISLALAEKCDAILMVAESPGANRERAVFERKGLPIFHSLAEIPETEIT